MKKIELLRAVETGYDSGNKLCVDGVGYNYRVNIEMLLVDIPWNERLLGVEIDNKFHVCYDVELKTKEKYFGYLTSKTGQNFSFQVIDGFDRSTFDFADAVYISNQTISLKLDDMVNFSSIDYYGIG